MAIPVNIILKSRMGRPSQGWALMSGSRSRRLFISSLLGWQGHLGVLYTDQATVRLPGHLIVDEEHEGKCFGLGHRMGKWLIWDPQQDLLTAKVILMPCVDFHKLRWLGAPWPFVCRQQRSSTSVNLWVCFRTPQPLLSGANPRLEPWQYWE